MVDRREPVQDKLIDAAAHAGTDRGVATASLVEGGRVQVPERRSIRSILSESNGDGRTALKGIFPFVQPDRIQQLTDGHVRARLDANTKFVVDVTDPEDPKAYLQLRNPKKPAGDPKSYKTVPLLEFSTTTSADERSATLAPRLEDVTKYPPLVVDEKGLKRQEAFVAGASFTDVVDGTDNLVDVVTTVVPLSVLVGAKEVNIVGEDHVEFMFKNGKTETKLVFNLHPEEGKPRGSIQILDGVSELDYSLEGRSTVKDGPSVVFAPPRDGEGKYEGHQVKLTNSGAKQLYRADEIDTSPITTFEPAFLREAKAAHAAEIAAAAALEEATAKLAEVTGQVDTVPTEPTTTGVAKSVTVFTASNPDDPRLVSMAGREEDSGAAMAKQARLFGVVSDEPTYDPMATTTTANMAGPYSLAKFAKAS